MEQSTAGTEIANQTVSNPESTSKLAAIGSFVKWVFTGFGLFAHGKVEGAEISIWCVHQAFFLWAIIFVGFAGAFSSSHWPVTATFWGWAYAITMVYTLVSFLFELSFWRFAFWCGAVALVYLIIKYPLGYLGMLTGLHDYVNNLKPELNPGLGYAISWLLLIPWIGSLFHTFANGRKTFTLNNIEEFHLGVGTEITDRGGLRFKTTCRDLLETILGFGAMDLVAYNRVNNIPVKQFKNVLFLYFIWKKLDPMLHERFARVDNVVNETVAVEETEHHPVG
jgi:hypothetical protein